MEKRKIFKKESFITIVMIILGGIICGIAFNGFIIPHKLLSGGVAGVALILKYLFNWQIGLMILILNIPIFILGYKFIDKEFIFFSLIGVISFSVSLDMLSGLQKVFYVNDIMLSSIMGGVLSGVGMGLVFKNRASQGGVDIIAVIIKKYFSLSIGATSFGINIFIITFSSIIYGLKPALYTLICIYTSSVVIDKIMQGFNTRKAIMIITDKEEAVVSEIFKELGRGVTFLEGAGAYTGDKKRVLYCIVTLNQLAKLKQLVREIDDRAFMTVSDTAEVLGTGFYDKGI